MPIGDAKHRLVRRELENALGSQYVHTDAAVVECYRREAQSPSYTTPLNPEFIVFPGSTADVRRIVALANRYSFPYSVSSTGTLTMFCAAVKPYWCWIDPKRMNRLEIDAKNMLAVVEPYVSHAQLSVEARACALFAPVSFAGSQTSVLATTVALGTQTSIHSTGRASRNLLGVEMVLPNGDVLRTGSLATSTADFWGEGPGPDLRGIVRSHFGHFGALGIITRIGVKLYPWPGAAELPVAGTSPRKTCLLPENRFRWRVHRYADWTAAVEAIRQVSRSEIGATVTLFAPWNLSHHYACSREEYWRLWDDGWFHRTFGYCLIVGLWGITSERQLAFESMILDQIVAETGGEDVPSPAREDWIGRIAARNVVDPLASRYQRFKPGVPPVPGGGVVYDSLSDSQRAVPNHDRLALWVLPIDLGHAAMTSSTVEPPPFERTAAHEKALKQYGGQMFVENARRRILDTGSLAAPMDVTAPAYGSHSDVIIARIKRVLDPGNLANPTRLVNP